MYAVCCMYYAVCCMLTLWLVPYGVVCFLCSDDACFSNSISSQPILLRFVLIKDRLCSQFTNDMVGAGESAEVPPRGGAIILARLRSEGGQVKSFSFFHWCVRGGGRLEVSLRDSKEEDPP
jgi:hypothetical protein